MKTANLSQRQIETLNYLIYRELNLNNTLVNKDELREILSELCVCQFNSDNLNELNFNTIKTNQEGNIYVDSSELQPNSENVYFDFFDPHPESVFYI